jgi:glutaredoxin 3
MTAAATIYTTAACSLCAAACAELLARGVPYTEVDIGEHPERIPELLKLTRGRRIVPVIVEGSRISVAPNGGKQF